MDFGPSRTLSASSESESVLDSWFVAFSFGKPVPTFPENALNGPRTGTSQVPDNRQKLSNRTRTGDAAGARGRAAVAGRLIEHAVAVRGLGARRRVGVLGHFEGVEAGAQHEQELIAQHLAGGAQLATKTVALADQPRLAERATVLE